MFTERQHFEFLVGVEDLEQKRLPAPIYRLTLNDVGNSCKLAELSGRGAQKLTLTISLVSASKLTRPHKT